MKINFLGPVLILFLLTSLNIEAQKLRDDPVKLKYIKLPKRKLPSDHKTYSVRASGPLFGYQRGGSSDSFAKSIKMDGFKRVEGAGENGGHLRASIYGGSVSLGQASAKTRTQKTKDKEGNEKTSYYYYYEVPARCYASYKIYSPTGEILHSNEYSNHETLKTKEYSSTKARTDSRTNELNKLRASFASSTLSSLRGGVNYGLIELYDYDIKSDRHNLYVIKKHSSEDQWEKHYQHVKATLEEADAAINSSELKEKLASAIAFYEGHAKKDPKGDKKLKRIYKAANYNLALLHFAVDEFEPARSYADKVIQSEKKDRRSRLLNESMDKWEEDMKRLEIQSIHYKRDLTDAMPPKEIAALEAEKEEMEENSTTSSGSIFKGEEEIIGTWSLDKEAEDLVFGEGGNVKFLVEEGSEMKEIDVTDAEVSAFKITDRNFAKTRFVASAKGETEAKVEILEEVYSSKRIKLFKYYPSTGALSDDKPEFAFQKDGQEYPISLESTMFLLWKKGLAQYFEDCPDLAEMASEGGVEKTKDSLIKAARVYSELCTNVIKP